MDARAGSLLVLTAALMLGTASHASPEERAIALRVTPATCLEPCSVRLSVRIAPDEANRSVTIQAESPQFYRRSTRQLDGGSSPRVHELMLNELPAGQYDVRITVTRAGEASPEYAAQFAVASLRGL